MNLSGRYVPGKNGYKTWVYVIAVRSPTNDNVYTVTWYYNDRDRPHTTLALTYWNIRGFIDNEAWALEPEWLTLPEGL